MNMDKHNNSTDADLGLSRRTAVAVRGTLGQSGALRVSGDVQDEASRLLATTAPQSVLERVLDVVAPSEERRELRRGRKELVRQEVDARTAIHATIKGAQVREIEAAARAYGTACELSATKEVAMRAIETEVAIEAEIVRSGAEFDAGIDRAVDAALQLKSESAREGAADRITRLKQMRGEVERVLMENVAEAVRGSRPRD